MRAWLLGLKAFARDHAMGYGFLAGVPVVTVDVPVPTTPPAGGETGVTGASGFPTAGNVVPGA
jgi:hypothetical protein